MKLTRLSILSIGVDAGSRPQVGWPQLRRPGAPHSAQKSCSGVHSPWGLPGIAGCYSRLHNNRANEEGALHSCVRSRACHCLAGVHAIACAVLHLHLDLPWRLPSPLLWSLPLLVRRWHKNPLAPCASITSNPPSASILEEVTIAAVMSFMAVFNNLVFARSAQAVQQARVGEHLHQLLRP